MKVEDMIRSIRHRSDALEQIEGALRYDGIGCTMSAEDRQLLVTARAELAKERASRAR